MRHCSQRRGIALIAFAGAALAVWPASAMPMAPAQATLLQPVAWVCDAYGRCWETRDDYGYSERRSYGYDDRSDYRPAPRPPTKWEQKGFCPPGPRKKGNC
jgi:hypothetical protein